MSHSFLDLFFKIITRAYSGGIMVKFQKSHYELIAEIIKLSLSFNVSYKRDLVNRFCDTFQEDNSLFSRAKFIRACGLELE